MAATAFLPRLSSPFSLAVSRWATFYTTPYTLKFLPSLAIAIPGVTINIPGLLGDIWESVLRAVPKNKVSHSKKRSRQMAGKALKDVNHLCKCPGCGEVKRTHRLCQHCLEGMATGNGSVFRCNANFFSPSRNEENMASGLSYKQSILSAQVDRRLDSLSHLNQRPMLLQPRARSSIPAGICLSQCFVSLCTNMKIRIEDWIVEKRYSKHKY